MTNDISNDSDTDTDTDTGPWHVNVMDIYKDTDILSTAHKATLSVVFEDIESVKYFMPFTQYN